MIELRVVDEGVLLPVRAQPSARRSAIRGQQGGRLKVSVTQVAEKGKANDAVRDLLTRALSLRKSQLELVAGKTSAAKQFLIRGIGVDELRERIAEALSNAR